MKALVGRHHPNSLKKGKSFDVNRRAVWHSIESRTGYEGLSSFGAMINIPCLSRAAYYNSCLLQ